MGGEGLHISRVVSGAVDSRQAKIVLIVTTLIYTLNVADRFIFATLLQPIKAEFGLSDVGVASLNLALGIVLMGFGVPAGILADRMSRRVLLAASTTTFSIMTACGGLTSSLSTFVVTRLGVGFGEAGCTPPALSLIADRFKPAHRGVAMTIFTLGICAGSFLGSSLAGWISDRAGWRAAMIVFGLMGLPLGLLTMMLVKEPRRGQSDGPQIEEEMISGGLMTALSYVFRNRPLLFVILGGSAISSWGWGLLWWTPTFFVRAYGLTIGESGAILGNVHLLGGTGATIAIAFVMHRLSSRDTRIQIWTIASITAAATIASVAAYATRSAATSIFCIWMFAPVLYMYTGPTYSLLNNFAPPAIRAKVVAIFMFVVTLGNLVLAPMFIGLCSDLFASQGYGEGDGLRRALLLFAPLGFAAAAAYAVAGLNAKPANEPAL